MVPRTSFCRVCDYTAPLIFGLCERCDPEAHAAYHRFEAAMAVVVFLVGLALVILFT